MYTKSKHCREKKFQIPSIYSPLLNSHNLCTNGTVQLVVGDEKTTVTMVLNKNLRLEINANTSSNERMPARHRSL